MYFLILCQNKYFFSDINLEHLHVLPVRVCLCTLSYVCKCSCGEWEVVIRNVGVLV